MSEYNSFISVVIVNYNNLEYLRQCISSLLQSDYSFYEIIVVDNGSSDGSVQRIKKEFGEYQNRIITLQLPDNRGFAVGNRIGAEKAVGKYILFLNNDTTVDPSCLKELVGVMEHDPSIGVAQAKTLIYDKPDTFDSAGVVMNVFGVGRQRGENEKDIGQYDHIDEISYAKGAAMIVRKDVWTILEGFESLFFVYFEESDFCWRVWLSGYRVVFAPSAKVYHVCAATTSKFGPHFLMFQFYRNQIVTVVKNLSLKNLAKYTPGLAGVFLVCIMLHMRRNQLASMLGNLHGIAWCLLFFRRVWTKRLIVQRGRIVNDKDLFEKGAISRTFFL
jgi:hypothetical protein